MQSLSFFTAEVAVSVLCAVFGSLVPERSDRNTKISRTKISKILVTRDTRARGFHEEIRKRTKLRGGAGVRTESRTQPVRHRFLREYVDSEIIKF